jgi:hypothetical protein
VQRFPALVVTGGWNPAFEASALVAAQFLGGRHRVIQSPHHFPQLVSREFNDVSIDFMTEADSQREARA